MIFSKREKKLTKKNDKGKREEKKKRQETEAMELRQDLKGR